jgi:hypothetical protein
MPDLVDLDQPDVVLVADARKDPHEVTRLGVGVPVR